MILVATTMLQGCLNLLYNYISISHILLQQWAYVGVWFANAYVTVSIATYPCYDDYYKLWTIRVAWHAYELIIIIRFRYVQMVGNTPYEVRTDSMQV